MVLCIFHIIVSRLICVRFTKWSMNNQPFLVYEFLKFSIIRLLKIINKTTNPSLKGLNYNSTCRWTGDPLMVFLPFGIPEAMN